MTNDTSPTGRSRLLSIRSVAATMVLFLLLTFGPILQCWHEMSRFSVFASVQLDMSQSEAREILNRNGVVCDLTRKPGGADCFFSDFWREYGIKSDPNSKTVTSKYFRFRKTPRDLLIWGPPR